MWVVRWGNGLAIRLPAALVKALALERLRALRKPLPQGWSFDRNEANER